MSAIWAMPVLDTNRPHIGKESVAIIALWELDRDPAFSIVMFALASPLMPASNDLVFLAHHHTLLVAFAPSGWGDPAAR